MIEPQNFNEVSGFDARWQPILVCTVFYPDERSRLERQLPRLAILVLRGPVIGIECVSSHPKSASSTFFVGSIAWNPQFACHKVEHGNQIVA